MSERTELDNRLDGLIDIGNVHETAVGDHSTITATLIGAGSPDVDDGDDVERVENVDLFGEAALLSRPADPDDDGSCEAIFVRTGDTREIIGTKDRRWQTETPLEKGETVLRYMGSIGGAGEPTQRPRVYLRADGSIEIVADVVHVKTKDAGTKLDVDGEAKQVEASAGGAKLKLEDAGGAATLDGASIKLGAAAVEAPAWASKVFIELGKIAITLASYAGPGSFVTPYTVPLSGPASIAASKTTCE